MKVRTAWWGCMLYATNEAETEQLRQLLTRTGPRAHDPYEEGDIDLRFPGEDEWDRLHGLVEETRPPEDAVACLVIKR